MLRISRTGAPWEELSQQYPSCIKVGFGFRPGWDHHSPTPCCDLSSPPTTDTCPAPTFICLLCPALCPHEADLGTQGSMLSGSHQPVRDPSERLRREKDRISIPSSLLALDRDCRPPFLQGYSSWWAAPFLGPWSGRAVLSALLPCSWGPHGSHSTLVPCQALGRLSFPDHALQSLRSHPFLETLKPS